MYTKMLITICIGLVTLLYAPVIAQVLEYTEQTGEQETLLKINITHQSDSKEIIFTTPDIYARHTILTDAGTQQWTHKDEENHHDFEAVRKGNQIRISGTFKGERMQKTVEIDESPWFNKLDHGLSSWASSEGEELVFWTLKLSSDLDPIKFRAEKIGEEKIILPHGNYNTVKVKLTLDGILLSKLWSAYCWYDVSTGLFLKFEGTNGGPGTPLTIIELSEVIVP